jgi:hypothetical protein
MHKFEKSFGTLKNKGTNYDELKQGKLKEKYAVATSDYGTISVVTLRLG